jgi:hypothetical protein
MVLARTRFSCPVFIPKLIHKVMDKIQVFLGGFKMDRYRSIKGARGALAPPPPNTHTNSIDFKRRRGAKVRKNLYLILKQGSFLLKNFVCHPFNESESVIIPKIVKNRLYQPGDQKETKTNRANNNHQRPPFSCQNIHRAQLGLHALAPTAHLNWWILAFF